MTLGVLEPWITAVALGLCAALCAHVAALSGRVADLIRLYGVVRPESALGRRHVLWRWRAQRRLWWALATACAAAALTWVGIGLGWVER